MYIGDLTGMGELHDCDVIDNVLYLLFMRLNQAFGRNLMQRDHMGHPKICM